MPRGRCPKFSRSAWFCPLSAQRIHSRWPSSDPGSLLHPTGPVSFRDCDPEVVNILRRFWSPNSSAVAGCPQGLHRTVRSRERSCRVPGSGRSCSQEGWKDGPFLQHAKTWKGVSRHAWQEEPAPNIMWLLFKAPLAIFVCADGVKCAFLFCFLKEPPRTMKHKTKGTGGTLAKG